MGRRRIEFFTGARNEEPSQQAERGKLIVLSVLNVLVMGISICGEDIEYYREEGPLGYKFVDFVRLSVKRGKEQEKRPYGKLRNSVLSSYKVKKGVRP